MSVKLQLVMVGDRIRLSVALLRQMYDEPDHLSELVIVSKVVHEPDGSKTLWLKRLEHERP